MSKYLFLFTVGPVQSFIAQARKTQDLYAGSQILTELVKAGIEEVRRENIIFPYAYPDEDNKWQDVKSLPNRFLAVVEKDESKLKTLGEQVETAVRAEFTRLSSQILKEKVKNRDDNFDNLFFNQIERHLDIHWVFSPLDEDNYQQSYKAAEALLGSVKNVRPFEQFGTPESLGEAGRKCSLDGENNALFFGRKQPNLSIEKQRESAVNLRGFLTEEKEGLSAVSFIKRYSGNGSFQSTAEIAVKHDEEQLKDKKKEVFECYKKLFSNEADAIEVCTKMINNGWVQNINIKELSNDNEWNRHFDYQPLFEENLRDKAIPHKEQLKLAQILQGKLASSFKTKYYALIMFDGDKIGEKLSKATSPKQHEDFSKALALFAGKAREILQDKGQTVYTGGDDFLGFVNLHYLFEVMTELRNQFKTLVSDKAKKILNIIEEFTFSTGIVIAHYKTPLAEVLKTVRKVEKKAKNDGGRNAFCITAMKHSGEIQEAVLKWGDENKNWTALQYITKQLSDGIFSNKFITNLTTELYQLAGVELNDVGLSTNAVSTEFKRLVKRALIDRRDKETNEQNINDLVEQLNLLYGNSRKMTTRTKNFVHAMQITDFLSRKTN